jgi:hypothetical protein
MTTIENVDSNGVLTRRQREELVLNLYFNQNKTYSEIAKIARMSPRDIKPIIDKAYQGNSLPSGIELVGECMGC